MSKPNKRMIAVWTFSIIAFAVLAVVSWNDPRPSVKSYPFVPDTVRNFREVKFPVKELINPTYE